ncbi:MAG: tRNA 2-thiouridine(34) synthase MnmA [Oscillospiraceae bacterium]|nr:tRNA 2-thiouridine(34) synthase MnmA [Oscillospiraceae bacterium]
MENIKPNVMVALSGGVDSSVAALLCKQQGFSCVGATMKLFHNEDIGLPREKSCCSLDDVEDARSVAYSLDMPFYVMDFTADFATQVIDRFIAAYQRGETPNPCIDCNRYMKFEKLLQRAQLMDIPHLATGHYARIEKSGDRWLLRKAVDETKDQSYVLACMTQEQLAHTLLPLGGLRKSEIRDIAAEHGFINAHKRDSQDICFVPDGDYAAFIEQHSGQVYPPGDFHDLHGSVLGRHRGLIRYTVGQRKGLGIAAPKPLYVHSKCAKQNTVTLCENDGLFSSVLHAGEFNFIACDGLEQPTRLQAKIRYNAAPQPAIAEQISPNTVLVTFDEPQRAIAPGQACVLYDGDVVVGSGVIV